MTLIGADEAPRVGPRKGLIDQVCPVCGSREVIRGGKSYNRFTVTQRYECKKCGANFREGNNYYKAKYPLQVRHHAILLYVEGLSLASVADRIREVYGLTVTRTAILKWLRVARVKSRPQQCRTRKPKVREVVEVSVMVRYVNSLGKERLRLLPIDTWVSGGA